MKKIIKILIVLFVLGITIITSINIYMIKTTKANIKSLDELNFDDIDCILVLGAAVRGDRPSPMLEDRLITGIDLYNKNISNKIWGVKWKYK